MEDRDWLGGVVTLLGKAAWEVPSAADQHFG